MSQRHSAYARKLHDLYATPEWVTSALLPHLPGLDEAWEPAAGDGSMARALRESGVAVIATELAPLAGFPILASGRFVGLHKAGFGPIYRQDFFDARFPLKPNIVSNPPFTRCQEFVEHALALTQPEQGRVAILQKMDWDSANGRKHIFEDHPAWCKKVVLTKRIVWFLEPNGKPKASPSENHCWLIWNWNHQGPATIAYGP